MSYDEGVNPVDGGGVKTTCCLVRESKRRIECIQHLVAVLNDERLTDNKAVLSSERSLS